jgi:hypothetical protein
VSRKKTWARSAQERSRDWVLRQKGSSLAEFEDIFRKQDGKCLICTRQMRLAGIRKGAINKAVLDHNHVTGKKRGVICSRCNLAIGLFEDSIELLVSAVVYLQSWKEEHETTEFAETRR